MYGHLKTVVSQSSSLGLDGDTQSLTSAQGDLFGSVPDIPVMPMLPGSPAASHRSLMKRLKTLEADRGSKKSAAPYF